MWKSRLMVGNATLTMVASMMLTNIEATKTTLTATRGVIARPNIRAAPGGSGKIEEGDAGRSPRCAEPASLAYLTIVPAPLSADQRLLDQGAAEVPDESAAPVGVVHQL